METNAPTTIPQDQHVDSRDFRVLAIDLISADGSSRSIIDLVAEIQIRQDMYLGFMSGEMLITDATGMFNTAKIHGGEYLYIHITEPEQDLAFKKAFRVYKMGDRQTAQESAQRYTLYFVSDEMLTSHALKISKAYRNTTVSDIATSIMRDYLNIPTNRIKVDKTADAVSYVIPNMRPFEALNWLASRAYSSTDNCWFFYENLDGYNFRSLQSIYKDGPAVRVPYRLEAKNVSKKLDMDKYSIDSFESRRDFDALLQASNGGYAMRLTGVNPTSREYVKTEYGLDDAPKLYGNLPMSNHKIQGKSLFDRAESHDLAYIQTDTEHTDKWIRRVLALASLNNTLIEIAVPGNVKLQAGRLMSIRLPYSTTPSESDMWDKMRGGRYLILAANHKFDLTNHRYVSILLLGRDSLPEALPATDTKLPDRILKLNTNSNRA